MRDLAPPPGPHRDRALAPLAGNGSSAVKLFLLFTALSFASALLVSLTSFTRIIIVLSFVRQGLGRSSCRPTRCCSGWRWC